MLQAQTSSVETLDVSTIVNPPESVRDDNLVQQVLDGDLNAYGGIMRRYNQRLFRIARSMVGNDADAMDIVQEAHIKAFTRLREYRGDSLSGWLSTITRNEALMHLRKHKWEVLMPEEDLIISSTIAEEQPSIQTGNPYAVLANGQLKAVLDTNVDRLPDDFRTVFVLRAIEQLSVKETAEILCIPEETVKTRYFRAKRLLREQLQTWLEQAGMHVYEVGGNHCDLIVRNVIDKLRGESMA